jgi:AcrR family transcriptional regulator
MAKAPFKTTPDGPLVGKGWSRPAVQERSRETRDRVLAAAEEVFAAKGYEGARMADIAQAAGCSVGALYQRFKDKDALFGGIADVFAAESRQRAAEAFADRKGGPAGKLRVFVNESTAHLNAHRGLMRAILERGFDQPHLFVPLAALRADVQNMIEDLIRESGRTPKPLAVRVSVQVIYGFIQNSVLNPMAAVKSSDEDALSELADIIIAHLGLE